MLIPPSVASEALIRGKSAPIRRDFDTSPLIVFYEVTQACGLVCKHCRACAQTHADPSELCPPDSRRLIDQLGEFPQPPMLVLTGGDPLCRSDIFDLIEHATSVGLEVSITPSATPLVTAEAIGRLAAAGIHRMAISIDGATAVVHDGVRGVVGSFQRSLDILQAARDRGIATQVNTTLTLDNIDQIDTMADLFSRLSIAMWSVFFLVPVGRASGSPRLSASECEAAFAKLWQQSQSQGYLIKCTEAPHYRRYAIQHQHLDRSGRSQNDQPRPFLPMGVNDGKGVMFVSHAGLIHPSGFMPIVCGLFPLQHVVRVYQDSPIFRALRDASRLEGKCRECEFRHLCGGSRARAYALTGNAFAQEPDCIYRPLRRKTADVGRP